MMVIAFPPRTYSAKSFVAGCFQVSGTLDGYIDLAIPEGGTYVLDIDEVKVLRDALTGALDDVRANCLYERDALLEKPR
ncbi:MAG TPA: hypothetical protein VGK96_28240 [Candidatus Sulfotelmatobacter sp.]|jgi:hypothetical protein